MKDWEQAGLAWDLVEVVAPVLNVRDHTAIFASIGAGNSNDAIEMLFVASVDGGFDVPASARETGAVAECLLTR